MLTVRPATPADLETLVAGNADMAAETEQLQLDLLTLRLGVGAVLDGRVAGRYWVAEHDGRVVGQLLITYEWSDWRNRMVWWIQSVYVAPEQRRRGVLKALYERVRREAVEAGCGGLRLYVDNSNSRAQTAYSTLNTAAGVLPWLVLMSFVVGVYLARNRFGP